MGFPKKPTNLVTKQSSHVGQSLVTNHIGQISFPYQKTNQPTNPSNQPTTWILLEIRGFPGEKNHSANPRIQDRNAQIPIFSGDIFVGDVCWDVCIYIYWELGGIRFISKMRFPSKEQEYGDNVFESQQFSTTGGVALLVGCSEFRGENPMTPRSNQGW